MRKLFLISLSLIIGFTSFAQKQTKKERHAQNKKRINALIKQEEEGVIAYKKHFVYGGKIIKNDNEAFLTLGETK